MYENFMMNVQLFVRVFAFLFAIAVIGLVASGFIYFRFYEKKINEQLQLCIREEEKDPKKLRCMEPGRFLLLIGVILFAAVFMILAVFHLNIDSPYEYMDAPYNIRLLSEQEFGEETKDLTFVGTQKREGCCRDLYVNPENPKELFLKVYYEGEEEVRSIALFGQFYYRKDWGLYDTYKAVDEPYLEENVAGDVAYVYLTCPDPDAFIGLYSYFMRDVWDGSLQDKTVPWQAKKLVISDSNEYYFDGEIFSTEDMRDDMALRDFGGVILPEGESESSGMESSLPNGQNMGYYVIVIAGAVLLFALASWWATH